VTARIAPSILSADFANLERDVRMVQDAGAHLLHVDVMDGHFVPNLTIGPDVVKCLKPVARIPLDVHLMVTDPDVYVQKFVDAGAAIITVHAEATVHLDRSLNLIRSHKVRAGVSINPATPVSTIEHALELADLLLVMSVNPGYGGQSYIPYSTSKIRAARRFIDKKKLRCEIEVDGGIDTHNMEEVIRAGAGVLVAGSAIFKDKDGKTPPRKLQEMLEIASRVDYDAGAV
jgi:ribulose-phosphate 3-epimerase